MSQELRNIRGSSPDRIGFLQLIMLNHCDTAISVKVSLCTSTGYPRGKTPQVESEHHQHGGGELPGKLLCSRLSMNDGVIPLGHRKAPKCLP